MIHPLNRTKESRDFGARYLNGSDQMSQEECINWCWNYKSSDNSNPCNVAVYEQKVCYVDFILSHTSCLNSREHKNNTLSTLLRIAIVATYLIVVLRPNSNANLQNMIRTPVLSLM